MYEYGQELFVVGRRSAETALRILYGETPMNLWNAFMEGFDGWMTRKVLRPADSSSLSCPDSALQRSSSPHL